MQAIDLLLDARWVVPVDAAFRELEHHSVAVNEGRIVAVLPSTEAHTRFAPHEHLKLPEHALIPGLVNTHTHAPMALLRGIADDLPLMQWLQEHIWPAESRVVGEAFVRDGARLAIAEMLLSGTTCFNDMYMFPDQVARAATDAGIRACLGLIVLDFPTAWAADADEYIHKGVALLDELKHHPLLRTAFAPHAPYTVSDAPLKRVRMLADELDVPVHMHVHETADEVQQAVSTSGLRPMQRLRDLDLLSPRMLAVHMTQLDDSDFELAGAHNINVVHCPESNAKLASGACPVTRLLDAGINVALGTDGAASNNDLDMFGEMRSAALQAKLWTGDATALPAPTALRMATRNGARALGLEADIGSLEAGKSADMVAVDLSDLSTQPVYNVTSTLVYAASRRQVSHVWIAGHSVVSGGNLLTLDGNALKDSAERWRQTIIADD